MSTQMRMRKHQEGLEHLHAGRYPEAASIFEKTLIDHGTHVGLLSDQAFAHYLGGDFGRFRTSVQLLESEFNEALPLLAKTSRVRTHITLSKFLEEHGQVSEAFLHLERALSLIKAGDDLIFFVELQQLRMLCSYGRESEALTLYHRCLSISDSDPQRLIEGFHSLLIAEARLFGFDLALARFEALRGRDDLQAADLSLCLIDLLEIAIEKRDESARERILSLVDDGGIAIHDAYEKSVLRVAGDQMPTALDLLRWTREVSDLAISRLTAFCLFRGMETAGSVSLRSFLLTRLQSYDIQTRLLLSTKWKPLFALSGEMRIQVDRPRKTLITEKGRLSFEKSPQSWEIITHLLQEPRLSPEALLVRLSKSADSAQDLESLRTGLLRLNRKLKEFFGVDWVVRQRKDTVELNPGLCFEEIE